MTAQDALFSVGSNHDQVPLLIIAAIVALAGWLLVSRFGSDKN